MGYSANVVKHSISPDGIELFTIEATYPLIIHNQMMTHRAFSRNTNSNRATPIEKMIERVIAEPYIPDRWPINGKGMVPQQYATDEHVINKARQEWLVARDNAVLSVEWLNYLGIHKEIANRLLIPWQWTTILITATEWGNFFNLRIDGDAQDGIHKVAELIWQAQQSSMPEKLGYGDWHLPFIKPDDVDEINATVSFDYRIETLRKISAARCARISFLTHHGIRDLDKDIDLADRLIAKGDMSPTEHQATPLDILDIGQCVDLDTGNLRGWQQFRKLIPNENRKRYERTLAHNRDESL